MKDDPLLTVVEVATRFRVHRRTAYRLVRSMPHVAFGGSVKEETRGKMPNWSDENGKYWTEFPNKNWWEQVEIPHPPVGPAKTDCSCEYCKDKHSKVGR